tara:strand:+ start:486 stop:662 length:177 start_codon:yes stop_codon:yes gene_type:complete
MFIVYKIKIYKIIKLFPPKTKNRLFFYANFNVQYKFELKNEKCYPRVLAITFDTKRYT